MHFAQGKNRICFICFSIGNLSNFAIVKSLVKKVLSSLFLILSRQLWNFFEIIL